MNRLQLINFLIKDRGYQSYLEIGCKGDATFSRVECESKTGVDPISGGTHRMASDWFFSQNEETFDLVFVDGLHLSEQVLKDVDASLAVLNSGGVVLIHDCLPQTRDQQWRDMVRGPWTGDVWKAAVILRQRSDIDVAVYGNDWGIGVVIPRKNTDLLKVEGRLTWGTLQDNRQEWLRLMDEEGLREFLK